MVGSPEFWMWSNAVRAINPVTGESAAGDGAPPRPMIAQGAPVESCYRPAIVRRDERGAES